MERAARNYDARLTQDALTSAAYVAFGRGGKSDTPLERYGYLRHSRRHILNREMRSGSSPLGEQRGVVSQLNILLSQIVKQIAMLG